MGYAAEPKGKLLVPQSQRADSRRLPEQPGAPAGGNEALRRAWPFIRQSEGGGAAFTRGRRCQRLSGRRGAARFVVRSVAGISIACVAWRALGGGAGSAGQGGMGGFA